ncbi:MAG TPA: hypothetical protein PLO57_04720 [Candidatus Cloacimonadota bacterium]|nr:hypothetical protein [Candidatus Cloacimonadota bacterium]HOH59816.1 hypothetical protein [Candidatus Cloacimonadota bacterium]HPI25748.1 hypothetical protein [Candidatus Cloacimonadota bacterium]
MPTGIQISTDSQRASMIPAAQNMTGKSIGAGSGWMDLSGIRLRWDRYFLL